MFLKDYQEKIEKIQSENKKVNTSSQFKYPSLLEVCEPGKTGFKCRKDSLLICAVDVPQRKSMIKVGNETVLPLETFLGVYPFLGVVMETGTTEYEVGDVVYVNPSIAGHAPNLVIKCATAVHLFSSDCYGTNKEF